MARVKLVTVMIQLANYIFITMFCYYKLEPKKQRKTFAGAFQGCSYNKQELKNLICHYQSMVTADLIVKTILAQKCDI